MSDPVGIAILGGGIFVQEAHLPALKEVASPVSLLAIYSRSKSSAESSAKVAAELGLGTPDLYHDGDSSANLAALLARKDIQGVIIALPISKQPEVIIECLKAGKHVLCEKPVAKDVATGIKLIETWEKEYKPKGLIWRVAENFECEPAFLLVKQAIIAGKIGKVQTFQITGINYVDPEESKWYHTPWRTVPDYQGGFLLDGGVHSAALLRTVLPSPITAISGFATLLQPHLAPHDCIHTNIICADGAQGHMNLNFGASGYEGGGSNVFLGDAGSIEVTRVSEPKRGLKVTIKSGKKGKQTTEVFTEPEIGVQKEQEHWLAAISGKYTDDFGEPRGALRDVAVIEAALTSNGHLIEFSKLIPGF